MKNKGFGINELDKRISELTCKGLFWGENGAIAMEKERLKLNKAFGQSPVELLSATSSTYYAASGNAASRARNSSLFLKIFWYFRAWKCLRRAEILSDKFAKLRLIEDMSLGELDVRACILNKAGRSNEALVYLNYGIMKIPTGQLGTKHDLCLFLIHETEIITGMRKYDKENKAEKNYQQAMKLSEDETVPALTKVRVMKSYGKFLASIARITESKDMLREGLGLAEENKLFDQAVKIKALLASIK